MVQAHQTLETSIIEDEEAENDDEESDEDEDKNMIIEIDEKEMESNEDSEEEDQGDEGSGEKDDLRDYDPETISEKIEELRNRKGKDYLDELSPPQQKNQTVSSGSKKEESSNLDKKVDENKEKKIVKKKKTLSTVNVRKQDEPEAKSLADLGRSSIYGYILNAYRQMFQTSKHQRSQGVFDNKVRCFICIFFVDGK